MQHRTSLVRRVAALTTAGLCGFVTAAVAAPRTAVSCHLITDPVGDTYVGAAPMESASPDDAALDLRSGDLGASGSNLVVVVRLHSLSTTDPLAAVGRGYEAAFSVNDRRHYLVSAHVFPDGTSFNLYGPVTAESSSSTPASASYPFLGRVTGTIDAPNSRVRIAVPAALLGLRNGTWLRLTGLGSSRAVGVAADGGSPLPHELSNSTGSPADEAQGSRTYAYGSPSCAR